MGLAEVVGFCRDRARRSTAVRTYRKFLRGSRGRMLRGLCLFNKLPVKHIQHFQNDISVETPSTYTSSIRLCSSVLSPDLRVKLSILPLE